MCDASALVGGGAPPPTHPVLPEWECRRVTLIYCGSAGGDRLWKDSRSGVVYHSDAPFLTSVVNMDLFLCLELERGGYENVIQGEFLLLAGRHGGPPRVKFPLLTEESFAHWLEHKMYPGTFLYESWYTEPSIKGTALMVRICDGGAMYRVFGKAPRGAGTWELLDGEVVTLDPAKRVSFPRGADGAPSPARPTPPIPVAGPEPPFLTPPPPATLT